MGRVLDFRASLRLAGRGVESNVGGDGAAPAHGAGECAAASTAQGCVVAGPRLLIALNEFSQTAISIILKTRSVGN